MENNEEDESIWDKEDEDHEHTQDCGHTDAQHAEMREKQKRIQKNFKKFLAENAEDMMEEGMYEKIKKVVSKHLRDANSAPTYTALKIFHEGFVFGMMTQMNVGHDSARVMAGINKMVKEKEPKKVEIDITQSKPLPPEDEKE